MMPAAFRNFEVDVFRTGLSAEWQDSHGLTYSLSWPWAAMDAVARQHRFEPTGFAVHTEQPEGAIEIERDFAPVVGNPGGPHAIFRQRISIRPDRLRIRLDIEPGPRVGQVNNNGLVVAANGAPLQQQAPFAENLVPGAVAAAPA